VCPSAQSKWPCIPKTLLILLFYYFILLLKKIKKICSRLGLRFPIVCLVLFIGRVNSIKLPRFTLLGEARHSWRRIKPSRRQRRLHPKIPSWSLQKKPMARLQQKGMRKRLPRHKPGLKDCQPHKTTSYVQKASPVAPLRFLLTWIIARLHLCHKMGHICLLRSCYSIHWSRTCKNIQIPVSTIRLRTTLTEFLPM
jgi:hypothetical protein